VQRRSLGGWLVLTAVVSILATSGVILIYDARRAAQPTPAQRVLPVVITATPDPNVTPNTVFIVVTATPPLTPSGIVLQPTADGSGGANPLPTLDPSLLPPNIGVIETPTPVPTDESGCPVYIIKQGDILGRVAPTFGVTVDDIMRANKLTERDVTRLQVGQKIIIPVAGCGLPAPTETRQPSPTRTPTPTPIATSTTAPAVTDGMRLEVMQILNPGDITAEGVELRNVSGGMVDLSGWTIREAGGKVFTFPDVGLFDGGRVIVFTRAGENTPLALFWGLGEAVWDDAGQSITIVDGEGNVQFNAPLSALPTPSGAFVPTPTQSGG